MEKTIIAWFNKQVEALGSQPALRTRDDAGEFSIVRSWSDYGTEVRAMARALQEEGVSRGDGVAILSGNRAEYHIADLGTLATGAVAVPVYASNSPEQVKYVLENGDAKVCFVENADQADKVTKIRDGLPGLKKVVTFSDGEADAGYDDLIEQGTQLDREDPDAYDRACGDVKPDDLACLIYTSGTTGPPKGAMLSHHNVSWTADKLTQVYGIRPYRAVSFLPLAHIAERVVSHYGIIVMGGETWFAGGIDTLRDDLAKCKPTMFFAVPRVYEKFEAAIRQRFTETEGLEGSLVRKAQEVGERVARARNAGRKPSVVDAALNGLLDRVVLSKVRARAGFGEMQAMVSGAAPITENTLFFFASLGLPIVEVYGQTEDCGPTTLTPIGKGKIGTVGPPVPGCDVKIADDGEILVKGDNVFVGYYKNEEATKETIDADGYLLSGDLGELDADGYLTITGRKKDLIITAGGKNISPQNIESSLKANPYISQAVAIGDKRKFVSALITLDADAVSDWASKEGLDGDAAQLSESPGVHALVEEAVADTNANLSNVEQIKKFTILPQDFAQEAGEITPTLKVKRNVIVEHYADDIDKMYD